MNEHEDFSGGCLCGQVRFVTTQPAANPHTCSCRMCQRHTGALTTVWVEFPKDAVSWIGEAGEPATYRSSAYSSRAFCANCGSTLGAIDDEPVVAFLLGVFDEADHASLIPASHSFRDRCPSWWRFGVNEN